MSVWDGIKSLLAIEPFQPLQQRAIDPSEAEIERQIANLRAATPAPWRLPSITEALGVPAIQRAVSLISSMTGMLSLQGYRNGVPMAEDPAVVARPDPFHTPAEFYSQTAFCYASRGEFVWWIASLDGDGRPSALIVVPLNELTVEVNPRDRLRPTYTWGTYKSTRYSPANPEGRFVHMMYPVGDPFALRGKGPLQQCGAAISVAVESQQWAANYFAGGGVPPLVVFAASEMDADESAAFKLQWMSSDPNVPRIAAPNSIEKIEEFGQSQQGAQMLDSRNYQNGDAARMFGISGSLLEYSVPGSSLTYQNLEQEFTKFVKTCLQPLYLEPIEQAMSDLLPRSTTARFNLSGFLRADAKTRAEVYEKLIPLKVVTVEEARQAEGYEAGDVEYAAIPFSPPAAIPSSVPQLRSVPDSFRCDGQRLRRMNGVTQLAECGKLLPAGQLRCPRCKKSYAPAA